MGRSRGWAVVVAVGLIGPAWAATSRVETWRQEGASAFGKGREDRVVISDSGRVRLAARVAPTAPLEAARVWDLARAGGSVFAATGDEGRIFRRDGDGPWQEAFDADDTQALSLVALADGRVFAGTGPGGLVIELTDPAHPSSRPDPGVQYIWDLAADAEGALYAATGPGGQLWRRSPEGRWSLWLDTRHAHLLSVAAAADGSVYVGGDGDGVLYRVAPDGKATVVYDAPQGEIRALTIGPDGTLYAGTASEAPASASPPARTGAIDRPRVRRVAIGQEPKARVVDNPPGPALPKPGPAGENVVYRVGPDGVPRVVFRAKVLVHSLMATADRLLIGTGPEGRLYEVRDGGRESSPVARLDHGQILAMAAGPGGSVLIGTGDPGAVMTLATGCEPAGSLVSEVFDAKLPSRFGAVGWRAEAPIGTAVRLRLRTGNVGQPDSTWSPWSAPLDDPAGSRPDCPPGRFAQYKAELSTDDRASSPALETVVVRYRTANLPPEIGKIEVPDLSEGDGATRTGKLTLKWEADDPNGDDLVYTLALRKDGWPDWVPLGGPSPLTGPEYAWDLATVPSGTYRLRVAASDRAGNPAAEALEARRESPPFLVDHRAPTVTVRVEGKTVRASLTDDLTRLVKAAYAVDGGEWVPAFPEDGLFDGLRESLTIELPTLSPGPHVVLVRATDAAGNLGTGDAVVGAR